MTTRKSTRTLFMPLRTGGVDLDYEKMTDDEFFGEIERIYGENWMPDDLKNDAEIYAEYMKRISTGV